MDVRGLDLPALKRLSEVTSQDLYVSGALKHLGPLVQQAELLAAQYDAVVANPPYMGSKFHIPILKKFLKDYYKGYEKDVFSAFIDRDLAFSKPNGRLGLMSPFVWMFISSHEHLRTRLIDKETITSLVQLEYSGFEGATVPICTFTLQKDHVKGRKGCFIRLSDFRGSDNQAPKMFEAIHDRNCGWFFETAQDEFKKIPGSPVAYWASVPIRRAFYENPPLSSALDTREGLTTGSNDLFLRYWFEVQHINIGFDLKGNSNTHELPFRWFPYLKGGAFRRWFGNTDYVVNWYEDGRELRAFTDPATGRVRSHNYNGNYAFRTGITWSGISSGAFSVRLAAEGFMFDAKGPMGFPLRIEDKVGIAGLLNSSVAGHLMKMLAPTLDFKLGHVLNLPFKRGLIESVRECEERCVVLSMGDWNAYERSWDFQYLPILSVSPDTTPTLESSYIAWVTQNHKTIAEMKRLEEENNRLFIDAYGLTDELTPDVPAEQITLTVNPAYRYGGKLSEEDQWIRFRQDTMAELVSYAIGCMMGRYSLDEPGLIYAHSGNAGFDASRYNIFPADSDGIVPLTDKEWFDDDACHKLIEFLSTAWDATHLEENLTFLADNLSHKKNGSSSETLRRYLCNSFFKDHLKTYKNRPIYWLFSSGKQKAFQCLVYLHRYNEGTLARMRTEYVIPLQGMIASRVRQLEGDIDTTTSTAHRKRLEKEQATLVRQQSELREFDEKLRHYADQRIGLDLDDGVKVNYGKFGDLLAEVKTVAVANAG